MNSKTDNQKIPALRSAVMGFSSLIHISLLLFRLGLVIFLLIFATIILFADQGKLPGFIAALYAFPYGDKVGHFMLMGSFSFLVNMSLACRKVHFSGRQFSTGSLGVTTLVTLEELSQVFFASRTFSLVDLGFSLAGIWTFGMLAEKLAGYLLTV